MVSDYPFTCSELPDGYKGSGVRVPREPVTVSADDPAGCHWETGKAQGRQKRKPGNLGRADMLRGASSISWCPRGSIEYG